MTEQKSITTIAPMTYEEQIAAVAEIRLDEDIKSKLHQDVRKVLLLNNKQKMMQQKIKERKQFLLAQNSDETMLMLDGEYKDSLYTLGLINEQRVSETETLYQKAYNLLNAKYEVISKQYEKITSQMKDALRTSDDFIYLIGRKPRYTEFFKKLKYHLTENQPFANEEVKQAVINRYNKYALEIAKVYRRYRLPYDSEIKQKRLDEIAPFALELNLNDVMGVLRDISRINTQVLVPIEQEYGQIYVTHHLRLAFIGTYKKQIQNILNEYLKEIQESSQNELDGNL